MTEKDTNSEIIVPSFLDMKYEYLFKTVGRDGKYSLKCIFLVLILFLPCLIVNSFSGTFSHVRITFPETLSVYFVEGWLHFIATVFMGVFAWVVIRFLKTFDRKIKHANKILSPPRTSTRKEPSHKGEKDKEWEYWDKKIRKYNNWAKRLASHKWYYFDTIGGAICGFVIGILQLGPEYGLEHGWVQGNYFRAIYALSWYTFYGFFLGACLFYIFGGNNAIRKYCKDIVSHKVILPLDPDRTGGLRELGRLSLDLDLIVALPSLAFPIYLLRFKLFEFLGERIERDITHEIRIAIVLSVLYAFLLVIVFFVSISPAHDDMVKAKHDYLLKIHSEYKDMHKRLLNKLDTRQRIEPEEYNRLSGLYNLYDRVESMAVWPLDFRTVIRFAVTSILPLLSVGISISFVS